MYIAKTNNYGYMNLNNNYSLVNGKNKNSILSQNNEFMDKNQKRALKEIEDLKTHLKKSEAEIKKMRESSQVQLRCTIIARRIISGNKVPKSDYIYLAKNDAVLYQKAILLRQESENPLKYKRVSPYEKSKCYDLQKSHIQNIDQE